MGREICKVCSFVFGQLPFLPARGAGLVNKSANKTTRDSGITVSRQQGDEV